MVTSQLIAEFKDRWYDSWVDLESVVFNEKSCIAHIEIQYLEQPKSSKWLWHTEIVSARIDSVDFTKTTSMSVRISEGEKVLWVSYIRLFDGSIEFCGSQGVITICTHESKCHVKSRESPMKFAVTHFLGTVYSRPL